MSDLGSDEEAVQVLRIAKVEPGGRLRRVGSSGPSRAAPGLQGQGRGLAGRVTGHRGPRPAAQASPHLCLLALSFLFFFPKY